MKKFLLPIIIVSALILTAGCTNYGTPSKSGDTATVTVTAAPASQTQSGFSLNPTPTDKMPSGYQVGAKAYKDPIDAKINIEFTGGSGLYMVNSVSTTVYLSNGEIVTESIEPERGSDIEIQGTKGEDRVTVTAYMDDGQSYKIFDQIITYRE